MTTATEQAPYPTRFREAEARSVRLGRPLKVLGRVRGVDEQLLDRLGRGFFERDELGAELARAMRSKGADRVTMGQLAAALEHGVAQVPDAPPALRRFCAEVERVPDWVDWDLVAAGGRMLDRLGQNAIDVLTQLSLIGGYRFGGPTDLLVATGGLTGDMTRRRMAETQQWGNSLAGAGAMLPPAEGRPSGEGWRTSVHVRAMHALVNAAFEPTWDTARWGLPINQTDQASTLGLFDGVLIIGCRALGVPISADESRALMHLWKYVGHLMGVDEEFLVDDEWERHRINYHVLLAQSGASEAGGLLSRAIVEAQSERRYPGWRGPLHPVRARYEKERLLSMLTVFLGPSSMRDLGLPLRPPWAHAATIAANLVRYQVVGRLPGGRARIEEWGRRRADGVVASYYVDDPHDMGQLSA
jgi:hypothetical protein